MQNNGGASMHSECAYNLDYFRRKLFAKEKLMLYVRSQPIVQLNSTQLFLDLLFVLDLLLQKVMFLEIVQLYSHKNFFIQGPFNYLSSMF